MTSTTPTVTRRDLGAGLVAYVLDGTVNGETYADELLIQSSRVHYSHASITTLTDGTEVVSLHKSDAAAAKGNGQIARRYHASVVVVVIADEAPEAPAEPVTRPALRDMLAANNRAYRTEAITRAEWVARNRELAALGAPLGMTLPAFALADDGLAEAPEAATVVTVLHNIDRDASLGHNTRLTSSHGGRVLPERVEAEPGDRHPLVAVFRFAAEPGETDPALCERAWVAFNESDDALATAYRARRLRSLSVGDVLLVETGDQRRAYACASVGWTRTNLDDLRVVEGAEAVRMIRRRFEFRANERGLAVTVPLDYAGCFHRCLDGAHCGGCGCVGCGYSDTSWPAGVPFGDLTPAQKDAAARRAAAQLETELRANADAIGAAMDAAERDEL